MGNVISNPRTRERIVFLDTARTTNGALFRMEYWIGPHGVIAGTHRHPHQDMTVTVLSGVLTCTVDGERHEVRAGESLAIPRGADHDQANHSDQELHAIESYRPACRMAEFFEVFFALARDGRTNRRGRPNLLRGAVLMHEFGDSIEVAPPLLRGLLRLLLPLGRALGYRRELEHYMARRSDA